MSHVKDLDVEVADLDALEAECEALGCKLIRGQTSFRWYGNWVNDYSAKDAAMHRFNPADFGRCEHAIVVPGAQYDVGVCRDRAGKLRLIYDAWQQGRGIEAHLGAEIGRAHV